MGLNALCVLPFQPSPVSVEPSCFFIPSFLLPGSHTQGGTWDMEETCASLTSARSQQIMPTAKTAPRLWKQALCFQSKDFPGIPPVCRIAPLPCSNPSPSLKTWPQVDAGNLLWSAAHSNVNTHCLHLKTALAQPGWKIAEKYLNPVFKWLRGLLVG